MQNPAFSNHFSFSNNNTLFYSKNKPEYDYKKYLYPFNKKIQKDYKINYKWPWIYLIENNNTPRKTISWKVHISSSLENHIEILNKTIQFCFEKNLSFKFLCNNKAFKYLNGKEISRLSSGKFIVIYLPYEKDYCLEIMSNIATLLENFEGQYILTDKSFNNSPSVYYRYGEYLPLLKLSKYGHYDSLIINSNYELDQDKRLPYFNLPNNIEDISSIDSTNTNSKLLSKYEPIEALHFSASGGVYKMMNLENKNTYIVKEARYLSGLDYNDTYSTERLKDEFKVLKEISDLNIAPTPIELIHDNNNVYLIESFIKGENLTQFVFKNNPLIHKLSTEESLDGYFMKINIIIQNIIEAFNKIRNKGIIVNDISPNNIIVNIDTLKVSLIDLEYCDYNEHKNNYDYVFTPGFNSNSDNSNHQLKEKIAKLLLYLIFPNVRITHYFPDKTKKLMFYYKNMFYKTQYFNRIKNVFDDLICDVSIANLYSPFQKKTSIDFNKQQKTILIDLNNFNTFDLNSYNKGFIKSYKTSFNKDNVFFPADPHIYNTNIYSVLHGAYGILYYLSKVDFKNDETSKKEIIINVIEESIRDLYENTNIPTGLMLGYSGIVWVLSSMGQLKIAEQIFEEKILPTISTDNSYFFGNAGILITSIRLALDSENNEFKKTLNDYIDLLYLRIRQDKINTIHSGLSEGNIGIALSLLYLYLYKESDNSLLLAEKLLNIELNNLVSLKRGIGFNRDNNNDKFVHSPYIYDGISGLGQVLIRFYMVTNNIKYLELIKKCIDSCDYNITLFMSYYRGMAGIISFLTDCINYISYDIGIEYTRKCKRICNNFITLLPLFTVEQDDALYLIGEQLYKCSMDYGTGSAGILLQLKYYTDIIKHKKVLNPNFYLDELLPKRNER